MAQKRHTTGERDIPARYRTNYDKATEKMQHHFITHLRLKWSYS
jgi:hypothetical protein